MPYNRFLVYYILSIIFTTISPLFTPDVSLLSTGSPHVPLTKTLPLLCLLASSHHHLAIIIFIAERSQMETPPIACRPHQRLQHQVVATLLLKPSCDDRSGYTVGCAPGEAICCDSHFTILNQYVSIKLIF